MLENQSREQYFFEDETLQWLESIIRHVPRVGAVFMPSMLRFSNVWVFDVDERFTGSERYTRIDVTRSVPDLAGFGLVLLDPPFLLPRRHLGRLLHSARSQPILLSASDWCVTCAGWGELFRRHGLAQVSAHYPRYRSIGNGYCETAIKRDGRTNVAFYSNLAFAPPRRPIVLLRDSEWITYDAYDFEERSRARDAAGAAATPAFDDKSAEIAAHWVDLQGRARGVTPPQIAANSSPRARAGRWARRFARVLGV